MISKGIPSVAERTSTSADPALDLVLEEITARIQAGELIDAEACIAAHPEFADRLRGMLPAMQLLVAFGGSHPSGSASHLADGIQRRASSIEHPATGALGDFRLVREIGRGGMGVVYEAEQLSIGRTVALKILPFASMLDERRLARFRNEVRAAGQLHHTNIVPIFAVGVERGVHFYAMQLVEGESLAEVIAAMRKDSGVRSQASRITSQMSAEQAARHTPESEFQRLKPRIETVAVAELSTLRTTNGPAYFRTVAQLAVQAAEALEHAHACGVVHRDVKPSNLLLDARGTLWLTDFGLARLGDDTDLTVTGDVLGTLRYMSPEQTRGSRAVLDHRTDVYSLGATLYELLALRPAFEAADRHELIRQIVEAEPMPPRRMNGAIPADLETVVLKALEKDAADRYETAQEMANDLRRFLEYKPIQARCPSLADRGRKWIARHAALAGVAGAALAAVAVVAVAATLLTLWAFRSEAQQRRHAEAHLRVAAESIHQMLTRVSADRYTHGDLRHAGELAADAASFYDRLLTLTDDAEIRLQAATSYGQISDVWGYLGETGKQSVAVERAGELIRSLVAADPDNPRYLDALAGYYADLGEIEWSRASFPAAQAPWSQAHALWLDLATRFPDEPSYRQNLAGALQNLSNVSWYNDRSDEAEAALREAMALEAGLPQSIRDSPTGLCDQAALVGSLAMLLVERGEAERGLAMLHEGLALQRRAVEAWPENPAAADYLYKFFWNLADASLRAGRHAGAAMAAETLVDEFPQDPWKHSEAASLLLRCAEAAVAKGDDAEGADAAEAYRRRARQLTDNHADREGSP
jgi:serine/threonine protein kinase